MPIIHIPELNAVINHVYCDNVSRENFLECFNGTANNFTFSVPLSPFMPQENLTLLFSFHNSDAASQFTVCSNCSECLLMPNVEENCSVSEAASSISEDKTSHGNATDNTYEVILFRIGRKQKIGYKFRLSKEATDFENVCDLQQNVLGEKFYEFNFYFYRACNK
ncbi:hypothetical protein Anas_11426 [Armadillidium nasatum]|uniref:Myelin gene regulatory factor C-terminal domain-containing protein n=1 Tax=Armadillidium nasatum TaxID=96803 RepID=A0A5N5T221_9CRUS|nr:hypothetical protein Anas_11426 [Armadillidium nasatum]